MPHIISHGARARESQSCTRIYSKRPNPTQSSSSSDQIINKSGGQPPYDTCVTPFGAKGVCVLPLSLSLQKERRFLASRGAKPGHASVEPPVRLERLQSGYYEEPRSAVRTLST